MFNRILSSVVAVAAAVLLPASAHAAGPQQRTQAPGFYRMMLGDFEITALNDGIFDLQPTQLLTNTNPAQVASLRGYRVAPLLWGSAFFFGAVTGYMRLAGADHYPTDVIVGATVATGISMIVPRLHVRRSSTRVEPMPLPGGGGLSVRGRW